MEIGTIWIIIAALVILLEIWAIWHIIGSDRRAERKMLWVVFVVYAPFPGLLFWAWRGPRAVKWQGGPCRRNEGFRHQAWGRLMPSMFTWAGSGSEWLGPAHQPSGSRRISRSTIPAAV